MGILSRKRKDGSIVWYTRHSYTGPDDKRKQKWQAVGPSKRKSQQLDAKRQTAVLDGDSEKLIHTAAFVKSLPTVRLQVVANV